MFVASDRMTGIRKMLLSAELEHCLERLAVRQEHNIGQLGAAAALVQVGNKVVRVRDGHAGMVALLAREQA